VTPPSSPKRAEEKNSAAPSPSQRGAGKVLFDSMKWCAYSCSRTTIDGSISLPRLCTLGTKASGPPARGI
jgi:hypothetical protein